MSQLLLEIKNYQWEGTDGYQLQPLNLTIKNATITTLCGPSQCGKSALAKHLCSTLNHPSILYKASTTICPQNIIEAFCPHSTLKQHIQDILPKELDVEPHLKALNLNQSILEKTATSVSIGQLKRIAIMLVTLSQSRLVVLDESLASLDHHNLLKTLDWLQTQKNNDKSFFIITHQKLPPQYIDHTVELHVNTQSPFTIAPKAHDQKCCLEISALKIHHPMHYTEIKNIQVFEGSCTSLTGESGSGKSSLLAALMLNDEYDTYINSTIGTFRDKTQWVFQDASAAFSQSMPLQKALSTPEIDQIILKQILSQYGLNKDELISYDQQSGGCFQVLQLARALARSPKILLLDEPTSAMHHDWKQTTYQILFEYMLSKSIGILLISHDPNEINTLSQITYQLKKVKEGYYQCSRQL